MVKLKITRPDGTVIEAEGSAADINAIALSLGLSWFSLQTLGAPPPQIRPFDSTTVPVIRY